MTPQVIAAAAVQAALSFAEKKADSLWSKLGDEAEKLFYPKTYRFKERNSKYKSAMSSLLKSAQDAAKAGDYVSAQAIAQTAQVLSSQPPYKDWGQISGAKAQLVLQASQMAAAYASKAGTQIAQGVGGTFRPGASPTWIYAALAAGALLLLARRSPRERQAEEVSE